MQIFNDPLVESPAKIIVLPVPTTPIPIAKGDIIEQFLENSPREYLSLFFSTVRPCMVPGAIKSLRVQAGRWKDVWFVHFPVGVGINFHAWRHSMDKTFNVIRASAMESIAIPKLGDVLPWHIQMNIFQEREKNLLRSNPIAQEVWAYIPDEDDDSEDEEELDWSSFDQYGVTV